MNDLHQGFKRNVVVNFTKADGTPGIVEGSPVWETSDETILVVAPAPDGLSADVLWAGAGEAIVTVRADGDLGADVFPIVISAPFNLIAPLGAVAGSLGIGEEVPVVV
jgi:hypothetical protein